MGRILKKIEIISCCQDVAAMKNKIAHLASLEIIETIVSNPPTPGERRSRGNSGESEEAERGKGDLGHFELVR